ncbi:MAG: penicillin-binding transpeptidase domain-containing protein [bacterium]
MAINFKYFAIIKRIKIPKRGRIRIILITLSIIIIYFLVNRHKGTINHTESAKTSETSFDKERYSIWNPDNPDFYLREKCLFSNQPPQLDTFILKGLKSEKLLEVQYSLDEKIYKRLDLLFNRYHPRCGAAVVLEPHTGRILTLFSYRNKNTPDSLLPPPGRNLALEAGYPCASIIKIVTAAAAMDLGLLNPLDMVYYNGRSHTLYKRQLNRETNKYANHIPFIKAFSKSINPVFGKIGLYMLGKERIYDYAVRFGFNNSPWLLCDTSRVFMPPDSFATAEFACGFNNNTSLSALHGALIASCAVNDGWAPKPTFFKKITHIGTGQDSCQSSEKWINPISPSTANKLRHLMEETVLRGTARKSFKTLTNERKYGNIRIGGKTGSLDSKLPKGRCDWFAGYGIDKQCPDKRAALAVVTVHGKFWNIKSAQLAAEIFKIYFGNN